MNALMLFASRYELKLCPRVIAYEQASDSFYNLSFSAELSALAGVTGVGQSGIRASLCGAKLRPDAPFDIVLSLGTCGYLRAPGTKVQIGDIYVSERMIYGSSYCQTGAGLVERSLLDRPNVHVGESLTVDSFLTEAQENAHSACSVDMEGYHLGRLFGSLGRQVLNVRVVSDYCRSTDHVDDVLVHHPKIESYRLFILELLMFLRQLQL